MKELAYLNGVFGPISEAKVSIEDRGYQFGDGIYEVVAAYGGRPFLLEQHMRRLRRSAGAIGLDYDFDAEPIEPIIAEGLLQSGACHKALIYIQITRGVAARSHVIPQALSPTVILTFKPMPKVSEDLRCRGARVVTTPEVRWSNCYIKAITLLPNVLAKNDATNRGYDDAIFVTRSGEVRECTSANMFMVQGATVVIPPRTESILHGVTQALLMECAASAGIAFEERVFDVETMLCAEELFMSSTTVDVLGITSVDDRPIADGRVGPTTRRLFDEFQAQTQAFAAGTPQSLAG